MKFSDLIRNAETQLRSVEGKAQALDKDLDIWDARVNAPGLSNEELLEAQTLRARAMGERAVVGDQMRALRSSIADLKREQAEEERVLARSNERHPAATPPGGPSKEHRMSSRLSVGEPRTYSPEREQDGGPSFLRDLYSSQVRNDPSATERLGQHGREVEVEQRTQYERAVASGGFGAFVPPQYIADLFAEYLRAGRPVANLCTSLPLPAEGMTVNVPRITTASTTAVQASENAATSNTDLDETTLSVPVVTVTGYTDLSRQAIERGVLVESVALADLASDYATKLDAQVLYGTGNSGQHTGLLTLSGTNSVTYTDASPTLAELWPKLADAVGRVMSSRFTGPTAIAMRPNVWAWLLSSLGTDNRPLINAGESGPLNALGTSTSTDYAASAVGQILGVPVVLDGNIPANLGTGTNETAIIAADFRDVILFEDNGGEPVQLRFDSVGSANLTVRLQVYGYTALAAGRQPAAISKITGTGLIVPSL